MFAEGRLLTRLHNQRERARGLRRRLLSARFARGALTCDMCSRKSTALDRRIRDAPFEVHHIVPLSLAEQRGTRISDLALLCASCHRILHRAIAERGSWIEILEARRLVTSSIDG